MLALARAYWLGSLVILGMGEVYAEAVGTEYGHSESGGDCCKAAVAASSS